MNLFLVLALPAASALTLDEAVRRAGEVDPAAVVAELEWRQARLDAVDAWTDLGVTPGLAAQRTLAAGATTDIAGVSVSIGALEPPAWFTAGRESAQVRAARHAADATVLDAQYAAATLYFNAVASEAALAAAREGERFAAATSEATAARVSAGLESELAARSARLGLLQAQAGAARAEADVTIARAHLARALQQEVDRLEPPTPPALPEPGGRSPWLEVAADEVAVARMERAEAIAALFPSGSVRAESSLRAPDAWAVSLGLAWQLDGVAGPFLRARRAAIEQEIAAIELDAAERDHALWSATARENARAADTVAEAARARASLADESLAVGQARLAVGLASSLEVLRLQDEAAQARADRVAAELAAATARLEARRLAGLGW